MSVRLRGKGEGRIGDGYSLCIHGADAIFESKVISLALCANTRLFFISCLYSVSRDLLTRIPIDLTTDRPRRTIP